MTDGGNLAPRKSMLAMHGSEKILHEECDEAGLKSAEKHNEEQPKEIEKWKQKSLILEQIVMLSIFLFATDYHAVTILCALLLGLLRHRFLCHYAGVILHLCTITTARKPLLFD